MDKEFCLHPIYEYDTKEYAKEHPEWAEKMNKMAADFNKIQKEKSEESNEC